MELWQLRQKQSLPLEAKIVMSQQRIRQWYEHWSGKVYVSFSGGKDSTVLLHLVRQLYPRVPAVFVDTGLEYPEIRDFVKTMDNVRWVTPKIPFSRVIKKYGFPVISKAVARFIRDLQNPTETNVNTRNLRLTGYNSIGEYCPSGKLSEKWRYLVMSPFKISEQCCEFMKKEPFKRYQRETQRVFLDGTMASDSGQRERTHLKAGSCNAFDNKNPASRPLSFWLESDIWDYIHSENLPYSKIYDLGVSRTGCMFCMFGVHLEPEPNRFQRMQVTHPTQYKYCMEKLGLQEVLEYINVPYRRQLDIYSYMN